MTNNMPGSKNQIKVQIRVNKDVWERYGKIVNNRSEHLRQHIRRTTGENTYDVIPPNNELLRNGWEALKQSAGPDGKIPLSTALARVAESTRVNKKDVTRTVIKPLSKRGYIHQKTNYGPIYVTGVNQDE